ncbi:MAG: hypothetical protein AAFU65_12155, partial [Pseudomonadota bacterium]
MQKVLMVAVLLLLGVLFGHFVLPASDRSAGQETAGMVIEVPDDTPGVRTLAPAQAMALREDGYRAIASVADVAALPTDFARHEAMYALMARTGVDKMPEIIRQAARLPTHRLRLNLLDVA